MTTKRNERSLESAPRRVPSARPADAGPAVAARGREILPHTADTGLRAWAPDLPGLFEEAAAAVADIAAEVAPETGADAAGETGIALDAPDLVGLAFGWLNELVGLADVRHATLTTASVQRVDVAAGGCRIEARARFVDRAAPGVRTRHDVKSATYHGLVVEREGGTWSLTAYLDI